MILLTSLYSELNSARRDELFECLRLNFENGRLDEIHLFLEDQSNLQDLIEANPLYSSSKLHLIPWKGRIKYGDLFAYANRQLSGSRVVIANADIYFDQTLKCLEGYDLSGRLLCLSRWNIQADGSSVFFEHPASQDAWIFQTPIREFFCDFPLGVPGCDNRLVWEAEHVGLAVSNPSRSIRPHHLHLSQIRHYSERQRVSGPTRSVPAIFLETPYPSPKSLEPDLPSAEVAFSETMGYTIARLETGISSHNNETRPFTIIPKQLTGLLFTQVVAYAVSSIEVEFLTSGKLYVLVGNDWDGYISATGWLHHMGSREDLVLVETQQGMGFEVWSLVAEAGQHIVIPTQVMLVADHLVRGDNDLPNSINLSKGDNLEVRETIFALTSLNPSERNVQRIRKCIESWREAGLEVRSFNHPTDIASLARIYDVEFVPVAQTSVQIFGRHLIPINVMLQWAERHDVPILLINSDIELRMADWELRRVRWLSNGGICYFVRHNHGVDSSRAYREPYGIDGFLLHGKDAVLFSDSFLSMGQPFWDYWIPYTFAGHDRPIYSVEFLAALHSNHASHWSWQNWHRCALEFNRIAHVLAGDISFEASVAMSVEIRRGFDQYKNSLPQQPKEIRQWVQNTFCDPSSKIFLELGAHQGTDTAWMSQVPNVHIHAFEPDPRNHQIPRHNVTLHRAAIADQDGSSSLILSQNGWDQLWTHSSSIKKPKNHLLRYPVTFGKEVKVQTITLDSFCQQQGLGMIDFIWADIQGAEGEMIRGGKQTLARTRYLYTEYSDDELYENQITLRGILNLLPDFRVLELWGEDVLLENRALRSRQ